MFSHALKVIDGGSVWIERAVWIVHYWSSESVRAVARASSVRGAVEAVRFPSLAVLVVFSSRLGCYVCCPAPLCRACSTLGLLLTL